MPEEASQEEQKKGGKLGLIAAIVVGSMIGMAGGMLLLGPVAAERLAAAPAESAEGGDHGGGHGGGHGGATESFSVENLVLNPAGTGGTRFLMATIVARVDGEKALTALEDREAEVRDRLMALLGSKTVDELSDVGRRETLKTEIRDALHELGVDGVEAVFLPTFVIQ